MRVYEKSVIKVNASTENGKVVLDTEGPLSAVASPVIKRINKIFQEEKPIRADDENIIFSTWSPPIPSTAFNRLISAQIGAIMKKRIPDQFSIGITDKCPYNCIHCGAAGIVADPEMTVEEINRAVEEAIDLGAYSIQFDGGETMLRGDIVDMVANVDKTRAIATCFTSGFRLTKERATDLKNAGLFATHISIDSPFESEHDRVRGREGAYQNAMDGIKNSLDAGMLTDMFVVVSPDNIDDLEDFYGLAESLGMHEMSIYEIIAVGRWLEREDETISQKDVDRLEKFQKEKNRTVDGPRVTAFPYFMGPDQFGCFAGRRWIHVSSGGDVMPCAYTPLAFGNIREDSLEDIWKRMGKHSAYKGSAEYCMMRNPEFRKKYIHTIPKDAIVPLRIDLQEKN
ncbi:radical SAM protein [Methanococcoides methylutens]|uniref:Radical SAM domain heme biosynthesis protein n=1 Tax=Methanococcoides methylutens MM1 TaxID=1434104 RepID=A0A0E3SRU4_METMT|nr:radical SAM protein [Methanococcoides methylutens]AKB85741.1 Radical SAM domain heme biosynthesis protein [Methanococcoides methylutens MM1]